MHVVQVSVVMATRRLDCSPLHTLVEPSATLHTAMLVSMEPEATR